MSDTSEVIRQFNDAFLHHDPGQLDELVGEECVMEAIQPAPDGARYQGRAACLAFWQALAGDRATQFETEEITVAGDRATIRWRYRYGAGAADYVHTRTPGRGGSTSTMSALRPGLLRASQDHHTVWFAVVDVCGTSGLHRVPCRGGPVVKVDGSANAEAVTVSQDGSKLAYHPLGCHGTHWQESTRRAAGWCRDRPGAPLRGAAVRIVATAPASR
jgi:SnoaL-like domain